MGKTYETESYARSGISKRRMVTYRCHSLTTLNANASKLAWKHIRHSESIVRFPERPISALLRQKN